MTTLQKISSMERKLISLAERAWRERNSPNAQERYTLLIIGARERMDQLTDSYLTYTNDFKASDHD